VKRDGTSLLDLSYRYGREGTEGAKTGQVTRVIDEVDARCGRTYAYDALGRLREAHGGPVGEPLWTQLYAYDAHGNRTGVSASGTAPDGTPIPPDGVDSVPYDTATNRASVPGVTYDATGNLTRALHGPGAWRRYQYDQSGRLVVVTDDQGHELERTTYGADRRRLITQTNTDESPRYFVWHGGVVIAEYDEAPGDRLRWGKSYVYLGTRLLSTVQPGDSGTVTHFHHPDRLSTRLVTTLADGPVLEQPTLPFGTYLAAESTGSTNRLFTTYDRSARTDPDYAVNRFYNAHHGRFMLADPIGNKSARPEDPRSWNLYAYVMNDPVNAADPSGLDETLTYPCGLLPGDRIGFGGSCSTGIGASHLPGASTRDGSESWPDISNARARCGAYEYFCRDAPLFGRGLPIWVRAVLEALKGATPDGGTSDGGTPPDAGAPNGVLPTTAPDAGWQSCQEKLPLKSLGKVCISASFTLGPLQVELGDESWCATVWYKGPCVDWTPVDAPTCTNPYCGLPHSKKDKEAGAGRCWNKLKGYQQAFGPWWGPEPDCK
jgi:RHS repeat-associated protein